MRIERLVIESVRNLARVDWRPGPALNFIQGAMGGGKTSLLEAIHLTGTGKSFRRKGRTGLIMQGEKAACVYGEYTDDRGAEVRVGVERRHDGGDLLVDGNRSIKISEVARRLPVVAISQDQIDAYRGSSGSRMAVLDWGLFHVEPEFHGSWLKYRSVLQQRNRALKLTAPAALNQWTHLLAVAGEKIASLRQDYVRRLEPHFLNVAEAFGMENGISLSHNRGWRPNASLLDMLLGAEQNERKSGFTLFGPHRADLKIKLNGRGALDIASSGQMKLLLYALYLSQASLLTESTRPAPILLVDDLSAALAHSAVTAVLEWLTSSQLQSFVTDTDVTTMNIDNSRTTRWFHVEQGELNRVKAAA